MNPPPPMLPALEYVTARAKPVATAASIALPPACRISRPASLAYRDMPTTIACSANVASVPALKRQPSGNAVLGDSAMREASATVETGGIAARGGRAAVGAPPAGAEPREQAET